MPEVPDLPRQSNRSSGPVVPHSPQWHQRAIAAVLFGLEWLLTKSLRFEWVDHSELSGRAADRPIIYCIWHNRLALSMYLHRTHVRRSHPNPNLAALVSASKDGALLAAILERFNAQPVRGSSSRRGQQALLELLTWSEKGYDLAITPDGPRGPRYSIQRGIMTLAQITGHPISPVSFSCASKITLRSWDRFVIPLPFSRCRIQLGKPILVPKNASEEDRTALRESLRQAMLAITQD